MYVNCNLTVKWRNTTKRQLKCFLTCLCNLHFHNVRVLKGYSGAGKNENTMFITLKKIGICAMVFSRISVMVLYENFDCKQTDM